MTFFFLTLSFKRFVSYKLRYSTASSINLKDERKKLFQSDQNNTRAWELLSRGCSLNFSFGQKNGEMMFFFYHSKIVPRQCVIVSFLTLSSRHCFKKSVSGWSKRSASPRNQISMLFNLFQVSVKYHYLKMKFYSCQHRILKIRECFFFVL